jgi:hypothetical protein
MRTLLAATLASLMSFAVITAYAQDSMGKGRHRGRSEQKGAASTPKADEKAYKAALDRIPDGGKYDPWGSVRREPRSSMPSAPR